MKKLTVVKEFTIITLATALLGLSFHVFMIPSRVSIGSVSGLSMVISQMTGGAVPISVIALAVNAVSLEATGGVAFFVTIAATIAACIGVSTACAPEKNR